MTRAFVKVGLLPRPNSTGNVYEMYPHEHPPTYGKWVEGLHSVSVDPDENRFSIDELFDELALISFETAEEQAQLETEFWCENDDAPTDDDSDE